ncbi:DUF3530 family protein [Colwellia sp. E2M01]|uniref:DUF3530 family protein n=1 Tax=Colwellia sp. E2M01 TaxID=2841561 RepID=UPI00339D922C
MRTYHYQNIKNVFLVTISIFLLTILTSIHLAHAAANINQDNTEQSLNKTDDGLSNKEAADKNNTNSDGKIDTATKSNKVDPPVSQTKQQKDDLQHYSTKGQVKPLLAGPDEYITLVQKYTSANSKGVVILLPEWQQGATNPKAINFLQNTLPSQGWNTIAIQPENKPEDFPSAALTTEDRIKENDLILSEYKRKLDVLFTAIMNTTKEYPGIVVVIAQGNNSALLVDNFSQEDSQRPNALILLSSYRSSNDELIDSDNEKFAQQLAVSELPVLDLYLKHDNSLVINKAPQRKVMASQEVKTYYRQRQLNNTITGYYPEKELLRQINSWLKAIGW